jgi:hypothetical protein
VVKLTDHEAGSELLEACRGGDRLAFRQLYDLYKNRVYSIALYFFHGDRIAASDVTQQVFLKLLANIGQFRGEAVFSTCFTGWSSTPASMKHAAAIRVLPSTSGRDSRQLRERIQAGIRVRAGSGCGICSGGGRVASAEVSDRGFAALF